MKCQPCRDAERYYDEAEALVRAGAYPEHPAVLEKLGQAHRAQDRAAHFSGAFGGCPEDDAE